MIVGTGIDIIEINRIEKAVCETERFLSKCFTTNELAYFKSKKYRAEVIAGNFAAKEAFSKAIGTGIRTFHFSDIEILRDSLGKPYIQLYNGALEYAKKMGITDFHISISHCREYAVASVIAERNTKNFMKGATENACSQL